MLPHSYPSDARGKPLVLIYNYSHSGAILLILPARQGADRRGAARAAGEGGTCHPRGTREPTQRVQCTMLEHQGTRGVCGL